MGQSKEHILFKHRWLWHVVFWVTLYLFYSLSYGEYNNNYAFELRSNLYFLPVRMIGAYTFIYLVIPFLLKRHYYQFFGLTILHSLFYGFLIWMTYYHVPLYGLEGDFPIFYWQKIIVAALTNYEVPALAATIKLFKVWYIDQNKKQDLITQKQQAELNFLKTQVHPHFLFNTLNNLYALTLKKADEAPDVVIGLSDLLRYMLYECSEKFVPLKKELTFLTNYIELQSIRHDKSIVNIEHKRIGEPGNKVIAPLLLLPIIENCFKHGITQGDKEVQIQILLTIEENELIMQVKNTLNHPIENYSDGLGISNVRRRLALIYPNQHEFSIKTDKGFFDVLVRIKQINQTPNHAS
ncbi:sensor histidine kinase [Carboxylicivirga sp. A043]|uniref:sensor histidine kinase n=1 Tax=Carboxylicivirga litoralis TaxID=2816963 RepID=UPI0021CB6629|nr:sensor histidine kinase [Carboxylicivirga sp. A043]MCU4155061.1 sensor histidine kinase [Carboxylicivirga sp. A043]